MAICVEDEPRWAFLQTAFRYYTEALELMSPEENPIDWSSTLFGRALCLSFMGTAGGEDGANAMRAAVADLLQVYAIQKEVESSYQAAQTLVSIAAVQESLADMEACAEPAAELEKAEQFLEMAIGTFRDANADADVEDASLTLERVRTKRAAID